MNVKFHRTTSYTWNFQNFTCVITILAKFDIHFLWLPWEIFFAVTTDDLLHLKPLKNVKKNAIFFKLFWYKVFVHWKLKLLNSLVDSVLNKLDNWGPSSCSAQRPARSLLVVFISITIVILDKFNNNFPSSYHVCKRCCLSVFLRKTFHYSSI